MKYGDRFKRLWCNPEAPVCHIPLSAEDHVYIAAFAAASANLSLRPTRHGRSDEYKSSACAGIAEVAVRRWSKAHADD